MRQRRDALPIHSGSVTHPRSFLRIHKAIGATDAKQRRGCRLEAVRFLLICWFLKPVSKAFYCHTLSSGQYEGCHPV